MAHRPTTTTRQHIRLRLACDTCSVAKVKCDKKQPVCDRCASNNFPCSYSPSRRCGKQSWTKRLANEQAPFTPATTASRLQGAVDTFNTNLTPRPAVQSTSQNHPIDGMDVEYPLFKWTDLTDDYEDELDFLQSWPQAEIPMEFEIGELQTSGLQTAAPCPLLHTRPPLLVQSSSDTGESGTFYGLPPKPSQTPGATEPVKKTSSTQSSLQMHHDCEGRASATLHSLHYCTILHLNIQSDEASETSLPASSETSLSAAGKVSTSMPSLDKVLYTNKVALSNLGELLDCPCAHHPHLALLYISILSKALFWYRVAASASKPVVGPPAQDLSAASPARAFALSGGRGVRRTAIQIGVFDLDEDDQKTLQRGVLLRETRKAEKIVEKMASLNTESTADDDSEGGRATSWYDLGSGKIRKELQETVKKIKEISIENVC